MKRFYLRIDTEYKVKNKVPHSDHIHVLLKVEHIDLIKIAVEPSGVWYSISVKETIHCPCESYKSKKNVMDI